MDIKEKIKRARAGTASAAQVPALYTGKQAPRYIQSALSMTEKPDAIILDLEDGVPNDQKDAARQSIPEEVAALRSSYRVFIRVNSYGSPWFEDDLKAAVNCDGGVLLPPKATPEGVAAVIGRLASLGVVLPVIPPLVESAAGVVNAHYMASMKQVMALGFGAGDLAVDLGLTWSKDGLEYGYARMKIPRGRGRRWGGDCFGWGGLHGSR